ncbi:adhesin [Mycoplasma flocculare]|uniref:P97 family adhesin n=1 Tax=Mesomycoplasma flocculare TaxID=2128 RepID=UPI00136A0874|nr:adhesin [Mesomycoplasma flocculare]MXR55812.1 adhesin [Mesomycoplasma flocculare]
MNKLLKSKTFKIGLVSGIIGAGVFGLTVGLSSTAKYKAENPRKQANDFASRISNLAFSLNAFDPNSDYNTIKSLLLDSNNQIKNSESALGSFSFFTKTNDKLEKINFEDPEYVDAKISFHIIEINPNDENQNFNVKFQVYQELENGDIAKSDIYEQTVSFAKQSNLLVAEFNFSLKKITEKLNTTIQNLLATTTTNFADEQTQNNKTPKPSQKDPSTLRAQDFQKDLNNVRNSQELTQKLATYFPALDNLINKLDNSQDNKLPDNSGNIFEFSFAKDKITGQFVSVQNQIPSLFLKADLTYEARDLVGVNIDFKPIINSLRLQKKDNSSYFLDLNDFIDNLTLKDVTKTDFNDKGQQKSAYEFLAEIKSGYFTDNAARSEQRKTDINTLLKNKVSFSFGKFDSKFKDRANSESLEYLLDVLKANIDPTDKTAILIPYTASVNDNFFFNLNLSQKTATKEGVLKLSGFKQVTELPKLNQEIYKTAFLPFLEKGKEKQELFAYGGDIKRSGTPIAQVEADALFKEKKVNDIQKVLSDNYDYDFGPYLSLINAWTGKLKQPKLTDIKKLVKDESESTAQKNVATILSRDYFRDGHQVANFYQDLLTKDKITLLETLFELAKGWGLKTEYANLPYSIKSAKNIFAEADKINFVGWKNGNRKIKKLSFNNIWNDESGIGFYGTLVLPKSIKDKLKGDDTAIFAELKKHSLIKNESLSVLDKTTGSQQAVSMTTNSSNEKLTEGEEFNNFGDVLKAFFLKAAQFNNFTPWAKLDDNISYSLTLNNNSTNTNKTEIDKKIQEFKAKITSNSSNQGKKAEGAPNQGKKAEGAQNQGKKAEGAQNQGKKAEGAPNQGKKAEGAPNQGKKAEGAQNQGKKEEEKYLSVSFSFDLKYNNESKLSLKTPELKMFLELESNEIYEKTKAIKELDGVVIKLQNEFHETSLDNSSYSSLQFPKKAEGSSNQGKKAEGTPNQENNGNKLTSFLPELGKKVDEYLKKHYPDKKYQTEVDNVLESNDSTKTLDFVLVKANENEKAEGAQNQGKKAEGSSNQGKQAEGAQRSTLKVRITVRKTANNATHK